MLGVLQFSEMPIQGVLNDPRRVCIAIRVVQNRYISGCRLSSRTVFILCCQLFFEGLLAVLAQPLLIFFQPSQGRCEQAKRFPCACGRLHLASWISTSDGAKGKTETLTIAI